VRQQQVKRRGAELQQGLVRAHRVVGDVDGTQDAAVAVPEFWRPQQVKAPGDGVEAVAAVGVATVPPDRLGVPVQADPDPDPQALERGQHRTVEQGAVRLHGHVHLGRHPVTEQADQPGQPFRSRHQRLAAVQDDVDAVQAVALDMLGNALDGLAGHRRAHPLGQLSPGLVGHFVDVAVRAGQIAAALDLQDELPEGDGLMARGPGQHHIEVEERPLGRVRGAARRCHPNQAAKSSGSAAIPWPARQACTSKSSGS
jgi:hypothetical protein